MVSVMTQSNLSMRFARGGKAWSAPAARLDSIVKHRMISNVARLYIFEINVIELVLEIDKDKLALTMSTIDI